MGWVYVARVEEIPPGHVLFREVHSQPVVLVNLKGKIYAFEGLCPHQQKPLCGASLWGDLLECPWHHFQFNVETGENYYPRNVYPKSDPRVQRQLGPLKKYAVRVCDGKIWVGLNAFEAAHEAAEDSP